MSDPILPPPSDEDGRRQRQEALRALAQSQVGSPASTTSRASQVRPTRDGTRTRTHKARRRPPWLIPSSNGLDCLQNAAWSPDAQEVALVGYSDQCPNDDPSSYNYQPAILQIYSAVTGRLIHTLLRDATVLALRGIPAPPSDVQPTTAGADTSKPVLDYTNVLWSDEFSTTAASESTNPVLVTLYDSATGKSVGTLRPPPTSHVSATQGSASPCLNSGSLLRWSADGLHLLVYSDQPGLITIWGPHAVPHSTQ